MSQDDIEALVRRLEQEAAINPTGYRRTLGALAMLGYVYLAVTLIVLIGGALLVAWTVTISAALVQAAWALLVLITIVLRALWVPLERPKGRPLATRECPELFQLIEALREKANAPRVHEVLLSGDFNAAVVQHPRLFGLFGSRNYLILGLPMMQALSTEEFQAVIAHEFGHLSGAHGRFGAWIYRLRTGWLRLLEGLMTQRDWGAALFTPFFNWYAPLFSAYSFVQARRQEYEADRVSVAAVGAQAAASALLRVDMQGDFITETFWPAIFKRADDSPVPTVAPFVTLGPALKLQAPASARDGWLVRSLAQRTGYSDTHPCLADRLEALGVEPYVPDAIQTSAADVLLGTAAERFQRDLDESWRSDVREWWTRRHQYVSEARTRLVLLERKAETAALSEDELWDRARFSEEFGSSDAAMTFYARILDTNEHHVGALWRRGQMLLARNDPKGIEQLSAAARIDRKLEQPAYAAVMGFHRRHGREAEAREYERRYRQLVEESDLARRERAAVYVNDRLLEPGLDDAALGRLAQGLAGVEGVQRALLARKQLKHRPERPLYILGLVSDAPWWKIVSGAAERALIDRVRRECPLPGETIVISLHLNSQFRRPLGRIRGGEVFRRGSDASGRPAS